MAQTLLLSANWGLTLDAFGNIAVADPDYSLAQDAASAIQTYLGECYFDTTIGVPWLTQILGQPLNLALLKQQLIIAALTVPGIASAQVFISSFANRTISGQVQVVSTATGQLAFSNFTVASPQGSG